MTKFTALDLDLDLDVTRLLIIAMQPEIQPMISATRDHSISTREITPFAMEVLLVLATFYQPLGTW